MQAQPGRALKAAEIVTLLTEARDRTALLTGLLTDGDLPLQHDPLMSPIVWDLGHIAHLEEVWLLENVESGSSGSEGLRGLYNPFENPRSVRDELPLPGLGECRSYMAAIRRAVLDRLATLNLAARAPLLEDGFVFRMVLQHEYQHNETMLQTLQLKQGAPYPAPRSIAPPAAPSSDAPEPGTMVRLAGGEVVHGTDDRSEAYDNERPQHRMTLEPFWMDAHPVTNGEYLGFVEDGGYREAAHWSEGGRAWLQESGITAPKHWQEAGQGWRVRSMDQEGPLDPRRPVCHVCYWEAEAYARWAGKRLPTEFEWEAAASWDSDTGTKSPFPWGDEAPSALRCNLDATLFEAAYNDAAGITADFNLNVLRVLNRDLGADFDLDEYRHRAFYDAAEGRIEMHLVAGSDQCVHFPGADAIHIRADESIRTEISCKYDRPTVDRLFEEAGMTVDSWAEDAHGLFALVLGMVPG